VSDPPAYCGSALRLGYFCSFDRLSLPGARLNQNRTVMITAELRHQAQVAPITGVPVSIAVVGVRVTVGVAL
jgi:hypothetical protein